MTVLSASTGVVYSRTTPPPHGGRLTTIVLVASACRPKCVTFSTKAYVAPGSSVCSLSTRLTPWAPVVDAARRLMSAGATDHEISKGVGGFKPPGRKALPKSASLRAGLWRRVD